MSRADIATILISLSALVSSANWFGVLRSFIFKKPFSAIPIIGGISGVFGILLAPTTHDMSFMRTFFWLPLVWDYGSVPLSVVNYIAKRRKKWGASGQPPV